jgi:probable F420-dependent oxidoreductase
VKSPPRLVLMLPVGSEFGADAKSVVEIACRAEQAGFASVSISDHVVMGRRVDRYPWGKFPFGPQAPWLEPLSVLTAIAAVTSEVRVSTGILIVPLRPAALLAKWTATIDVLSDGRLDLAVGTGWQQEEFEAAGLEHSRRGQMLTDNIAACRVLWGPSPASFASPTVSFKDIYCEPKPRQAGGPPVFFSGTLTARNVRRIVELGEGWIPIMGERLEGIRAGIELLREALAQHGRDPSTLRVRSTARIVTDEAGAADLDATMAGTQRLLEVGVTELALPINAFATDRDRLAGFFTRAQRWLAEQ